MANEIQQRRPSPLATFNEYILKDATQGYLGKVLGDARGEFVSNVVALVSASPMLQRCEPSTVMFAAIKATALRLPIDASLGFAYVVPYGGVAQFQIGWRGLVQLALRTNLYRTINVRDVRRGEIVGEDFASGELRFSPLPAERRASAEVVGYLSFFELCNGFRKMGFWTVEDIRTHAQRFSKTYANGGGVWASNFDAMAKKTALKLLLSRFGPLSVEMQGAISADQAVLSAEGPEYADNRAAVSIEAEAEAQGDTIAAKVMAASAAAIGKTNKTNNND